MSYGESLNSLLINLHSVFKKNIVLDNVSFQKISALSIIPIDGIEMSPLSLKLCIDNSTTTRLIIGMEKIGWVKRVPSTLDRRVTQVFLTEKGIDLQIDLDKQIDAIGEEVERYIDSLDRQKFIENLTVYLHQVEYYLIMKVPDVEKLL